MFTDVLYSNVTQCNGTVCNGRRLHKHFGECDVLAEEDLQERASTAAST